MGALIGYARVSTEDQSLEVQVAALEAAGCNPVRQEKKSGTTTEGRTELASVLDFLRPGDTLVVTRIDRLARSIADLADIVRQLEKKGVSLKATEQPIDTSTPAGRAFLQMLGVFAEFETAIRRERQMEGIAKAKKAGVYKGRPANQDRNSEIADMIRAKVPWSKIMDATGCARGTVAKIAAVVKREASAAA
jgi:DNA invertase Pin-like site-specific DNA recombinase